MTTTLDSSTEILITAVKSFIVQTLGDKFKKMEQHVVDTGEGKQLS